MVRNQEHTALFEEIHTPLSEIREEIIRRQKDSVLRKKVEDFIGGKLLKKFGPSFRGVLSKPVITPDKEFEYFLDICKDIEVVPIGLEYHDKFVAKNPDKYYLAKLHFSQNERCDNVAATTMRIVDFNKYEGQNIAKVKTLNGGRLLDFHHSFLLHQFPEMNGNVVDITEWFGEARVRSPFYYLYFLSLFVCHGVLFENYILEDKEEMEFFMKKIYPSFKEVTRIFGVKPLIFPLLPIENVKSSHWATYPCDTRKWVEQRLNNGIMVKWITTWLKTLHIAK